ELAAQQEKAAVAAQREREMADAEASLRAELATQREKVATAAQREREMAEGHAEQVAQMQAALNISRARLVAQEMEKEAQEDKLGRRLASTRTVRDVEIPRELRGIGHLIRKKRRRLARDYRAVASSPLFDRDWYLETHPDVAAAHCDPVLHYLHHGAAEG